MNKALSIIAVVLASAALLTAVLTGGGNPHPTAAEATADSANTLATQFEKLQKDHQALKESTRELLRKVAQMERAKAAGTAGSVEPARFKQRLDDVDSAELARLKQRLDELAAKERDAAKEKEMAEAHSIVTDSNQTPEARVKQAHKLKRSGQFDDQAVKAMGNLYRQTDKGNLEQRLIVLDVLGGVAPLDLRDEILVDLNREFQGEALSGLSRKFRRTAIGALEPMLPDPSVQEWLNYLAKNDPDPDIAAHAGKRLGLAPPPAEGRGK